MSEFPLKKNNGQKLNYDLVNLKTSSTDDKVEFKKFKLNITYNGPSKTFMSVTSKLEVKYQNKSYFMGIKSNQGGIGNITYEFVGSGSAAFAFLGQGYQRICFKLELQKDRFKMRLRAQSLYAIQ